MEAAKQAFSDVLEVDPKHVGAYQNMALVLIQQDEIPKAISYLERAAELAPGEPNVRYLLASAYTRFGDFPKAKETYIKTLELNPKMIQAHHDLGLLYFRTGEYPKAIDSFKEVLKLNPQVPNTLLALGMSYIKNGQSANAVEVVMQLRAIPAEAKARALERLMQAVAHPQAAVQEPGAEVLDPIIKPNTKPASSKKRGNPLTQQRRKASKPPAPRPAAPAEEEQS